MSLRTLRTALGVVTAVVAATAVAAPAAIAHPLAKSTAPSLKLHVFAAPRPATATRTT
jgi:hypothetical protein